MLRFPLHLVAIALVLCAGAAAVADDIAFGEAEDLAQLEENEITADVEGVRLFLEPPGPSEEDVRLARLFAAQLGSEKFAEREAASQKLLEMGLDAWDAVQKATQSKDFETRSRARGILAKLTRLKEKRDAVLPAVLRTIVRQEMKGLAAEVLKAAPDATTPAGQVCLRRALWTTAGPDDAAVLREAIAGGDPAQRIAAVLALPAALPEAAREDLLPLLSESDFAVRFAAAQALAPMAREESLSTFAAGLESEELPVRNAAFRVLHALTSQHFGFAAYGAPERRTAPVEKWKEWLAAQAAKAPLRQPLAEGPMPMGRYLICRLDPYSVSELDDTQRVTFHRQSETPEDEAYSGCAVSDEGYRVLAGFGSIIAFQGDGQGNEVWRLMAPEEQTTIDRTPHDSYLLGLFDSQELREMNTSGEIIRQAKLPGNPSDVRWVSSERVLVALYSARQVVEIDPQGEIVWKIDNVPPPESARRLVNGNTLITTAMGKAIEYAPDGTEVWSYKQNIPLAYDALELPSGNILIGYRRGLREIDRAGETVREWPATTVRRICAY
jgi:hypothetical protein